MIRRIALLAAVPLLLAGASWADTFTVTDQSDGLSGTLRWAIVQANLNSGPDLIDFDPGLAGKVILPLSALPDLVDSGTTIDGDTDGDGDPDIAINGKKAGTCSGLVLKSHPTKIGCSICNLAITRFVQNGIYMDHSNGNTVRGCYLGINLAGTAAVRNGQADIALDYSVSNLIGGPTAGDRNYFSGGGDQGAIVALASRHNRVRGNYFGLTPSGAPVPEELQAVKLTSSGYNTIGGENAGEGNIFAHFWYGVIISSGSEENIVAGNYFGLAPDGDTLLPIAQAGVLLEGVVQNNTIGGTTAGARNVFAGDAIDGVKCEGPPTNAYNKIRGNYFGLNAAGTAKRRLKRGVTVTATSGPQIIGGGGRRSRNYFCPARGSQPQGVYLKSAGDGSVIQRNWFGLRPNKRGIKGLHTGILCERVGAQILDNTIAFASSSGILVSYPTAAPRIFRNTFRNCEYAVWISGNAHPLLGNLGNRTIGDDGGNYFKPTNDWFINNNTANLILAEGNDFGTTSADEINAKIRDYNDDNTLGVVDFDPLMGGVSPTTAERSLLISSASALPTAGGAEIAFTLSAAADVTVSIFNIAGRPVATVAREKAFPAGLQRTAWTGHSHHGVAAPAGVYLVRVSARDDHGQQAQSVCTLRLTR
jgi:hypothetical protein